MPAGVSWGQYIRFTMAAMLSMFAGSQVVHTIYNPLKGLDQMVDSELNSLKREYIDQVESKMRKEKEHRS